MATAGAASLIMGGAGSAAADPPVPCGLRNATGTGGGYYVVNCVYANSLFRLTYYAGTVDHCLGPKEWRYYSPSWHLTAATRIGSC